MKKALMTVLITLGIGISPYSMAAVSSDANKDSFVDIIGNICQRQGLDTMILKQSGQTPEATQTHINEEILEPLQKDIESIPNIDASLSNTIIKLATSFSQAIIAKAWEDDTNVIQQQMTKYDTEEITEAQQNEIWGEIMQYSTEFSQEMSAMCQSQVNTILPSN